MSILLHNLATSVGKKNRKRYKLKPLETLGDRAIYSEHARCCARVQASVDRYGVNGPFHVQRRASSTREFQGSFASRQLGCRIRGPQTCIHAGCILHTLWLVRDQSRIIYCPGILHHSIAEILVVRETRYAGAVFRRV